MIAAVHFVSISVGVDNPVPYLRISWDDPATGESKVVAMLKLGALFADENNVTINELADQIIQQHLEVVHQVQAHCEKGMRDGED